MIMADEKPVTLASLKNYLVWLLARQDYAQATIVQKLKQRQATSEQIAQLVDWAIQLGYIDDERYCRGFIQRHAAKHHGLMRIRQEAAQKGLNREIIENALNELEIDWYQLAQSAYNKKFSRSNKKLDFKEKAKQMRYLSYRGFNRDEIEFAMQTNPSDE